MLLVTFIFGNNIDTRTIMVKGSTMRYAMHWAAKQFRLKECNLVFISLN